MGLSKSIVLLLAIVLLSKGAWALTITPTSWSATINAGDSQVAYFNLAFPNTQFTAGNGETCVATATGDAAGWTSMANGTQFTNLTNVTIQNFPISATVPNTALAGLHTGTISFVCSYPTNTPTITLNFQVNAQAKSCMDYVAVSYYPSSPQSGQRLIFWITNTTSGTTMDAQVTIDSTNSQIPETQILCTAGKFCDPYVIPINQGDLLVTVTLPNNPSCANQIKQLPPIILSGSISNSTGGSVGGTNQLIISTGKATYNFNESFQVLVYTSGAGPTSLATIQITGINTGYSWTGSTNSQGFVIDNDGKTWGRDIIPPGEDTYKVFASKEGFGSAQASITTQRQACPDECCPTGGQYVAKECGAGNNCTNDKCVPIAKPQMTLSCSPNTLNQFEEVKCQLQNPSGSLITGNTPAHLTQTSSNIDEQIIFTDGVYTLSQGFTSPGDFQITVADTVDYKGSSFSGTVSAPEIPWLYVGIIIVVIVLVIVALVLLRRRKGTGGYTIPAQTGVVIEKQNIEK